MKLGEIYEILNTLAPFEDAESWDNSGILLGETGSEISDIYLSLDVTSELVEKAWPGSLLIVHHPLIFKGLKSLNPLIYPSNLIYQLIQKNISVIAMHTNFDKHLLNKYVAREILGYEIYESREFLEFMRVDMSFYELVSDIKAKFNMPIIRAVNAKAHIKTIALCTGSGSELNENLGVDCFITGDIKYHSAIQNLENKVCLIDINHFESERYFGACLAPHLPKDKIKVIINEQKNPFKYY
ncbi:MULTISPECIES: Nif3-like dinuclear metal center hexameric protein [unclassified Campylobacter]|uniref:Nif3-like dinuclear metal center hexameric protein n=1 Tax=unclassified Campylobacter TaxID=2593542 RepID=UPI0022E9BE86|nr:MULTISPECIES: Nif3-like dinuclear metal center hexameric protein [unclassified Campylobacter]MDA3055045.1 Nif3-like dinuclear metal center hexameric protein [Campylobacter sp. VBCF_07 NA4]MDA3070187.1 Nif3-like dinuclear metal center hexameric protein [Campylobacter sp. VBCF_08 NA3]WBR54620.1 Nif3-like dinuclear metal center hexameric protein [Campylobacter sp. VBCF_01 NA2]